MKKLSTLMLALVVIGSMTVRTGAQIKNVLLEQHTGAWCGWCPDGTVKSDEIVALYGDQVFVVKVHNGDAMVIPEQATIANALGLTGFPTASIDRKNFGGSVFLSRSIWKTTCEAQMQQRAKAEVDCFYTLDRSSRTVRIQVIANIVESMNLPLRFNAFIVEDDVTGQGSGYNQANYLSGRPGYEGNPYYYQPSTIVGYHHMKVVRKMLGGAWGAAGSLPATVKAGDLHSYEFVSRIDDAWKIDDVFFVGVLQANAANNKQIINSALAVEGGSLANRIIDSDTPTAKVLPRESDFSNVYTLQNATNRQQTYKVTLFTTAKTPADWSAGLASGTLELTASGTNEATGQIVVAANSTAELSLTLSTGQILGVGDAKMLLELQGTPTITRSRMISAISADIEKVLIESGSNYSLRPYLNATEYSDAVTLDPSDYLAFAGDMTNLKLAIWNKGPSGSLSPDEISLIKNSGKVSNFVCGDYVLWGLYSANSLGSFGLEYLGWNLEGLQSNGAISISGQAGDVITGSLGQNIGGRLIQYLIDLVKITDTANVLPIMHFQNNGTRQYGNSLFSIRAEDAIFGVRTTKNNTRTVLLGISPYVINDAVTRRTLIHNVLDWLDVDEPAGGLLEDFETGDFTRFPWTRSGHADWTVMAGEGLSGSCGARAGAIGSNQASRLTVTLDCNDGQVSFYCKTSCESRFDYLKFTIDGAEQGRWSGEQDWTQVSFPVTEGARTFEWTYSKDTSGSSGDDTAWIDDVAFPITPASEPAASAPASGPFLAAYWAQDYATHWTDLSTTIEMRDYFAAAGYEILNADQLKTWMDARIADRVESVVVFCKDLAPDTVVEKNTHECTLRKYLDAGGKIVWHGDIPFYNHGHRGGTYTIWGESGQANILAIGSTARWGSGNRVTITRYGLEWGLTQTWASNRSEHVRDVDIVLASDGLGNAAAWVKHFVSGDGYRGFVRLFDRDDNPREKPNFQDVQRVAEYGLNVKR